MRSGSDGTFESWLRLAGDPVLRSREAGGGDTSKIDSVGFTTIIGLTEIDRLVTDIQAPEDFVAALRDEGVEVILAQRLRYFSRVRSLGGEGRCPTNVGLWTTEGKECRLTPGNERV